MLRYCYSLPRPLDPPTSTTAFLERMDGRRKEGYQGGVTADSDSAGQYTGVTCHTWHRLRDCHAQSHVTVCVNSHLDENLRPLVQFWCHLRSNIKKKLCLMSTDSGSISHQRDEMRDMDRLGHAETTTCHDVTHNINIVSLSHIPEIWQKFLYLSPTTNFAPLRSDVTMGCLVENITYYHFHFPHF